MTISLPQPIGTDRHSPLRVVRDLPEIVRTPRARSGAAGDCVRIGPFEICDRSQSDVVAEIVAGALAAPALAQPWVTYALHVGGLNSRRDKTFVASMAQADLVYADGMSVVMLARMAGATAIERAGTTDIGWEVMAQLSAQLGRPARVALIGGPDGLTRRAAEVLVATAGVEVVMAEHGFHDDWTSVLSDLAASDCDLLVVGLGAPLEMSWVQEHRDQLPACAVMTCGGWFGFITEDEKRAPEWACRSGLEWTYRLAQSPRRLWRRYATGALSMALMALTMTAGRSPGRAIEGARVVEGEPVDTGARVIEGERVIDLR